MTTIASEGATVELEKGDEFGLQCARGKKKAIHSKMSEYCYNHWNLLASEASPSTGDVGASDGCNCNWRCSSTVGEEKGDRLGL